MSWSTFWHNESLRSMFHLMLPVGEKILRPIVVYYLPGRSSCAIFGKRELAQLNPLDLVVLLSPVKHGSKCDHRRR